MFRTILLQATPAFDPSILLWVGIIAVFYFFMIRPQQKKAKNQKKFISELKKGDEVVTLGGIHGKIHAVSDTTVSLEVDKSTKLIVEKSSISLEGSKKETK